MASTQDSISNATREFIAAQHMFFVATAPLSGDGRVNVSPKGLDCFRILDWKRIGYVDYTGSGIETVAHVRENGRLTIMFCAFEGKPNILRLQGKARVIEPGDADFEAVLSRFAPTMPVRSIITLDVERVSEACGFGVPLYQFLGDRNQLMESAARKGETGLREYQRRKNAVSIDGLPGLRRIEGGLVPTRVS